MEGIAIINGKTLSEMCDYSFGDQMGSRDPEQLPGGFMKPANLSNTEFLERVKEFEGRVMTLFIDNIRLYPRSLEVDAIDAPWVAHLMETNDLLGLCTTLKDNRFVIFCSHEDTPIDDQIVIPDNVLGIHAVNAGFFGGKVHPFPYGLQRPINRKGDPADNRIGMMREIVEADKGKSIVPSPSIYVNCGIGRHESRKPLLGLEGKEWATTRFDKNSMPFPYDQYDRYLWEILSHMFVACPEGHGLDCHRNWETLYLWRVPVMLEHPYHRRLMEGFPVLFVEKWDDVTEDLLKESAYLYEEAQRTDLSRLDLNLMFNEIMKSYENHDE